LKSGFFNILGGNFPPIPPPYSPAKATPLTLEKSFEQSKEMSFDRRLANVTFPVVPGLYCPSNQNLIQTALHEITVNSQS